MTANPDLLDRPWRKAFSDAADWDGPIETGTLPGLFDRAVSSFADRPAIEFRNRRTTYRALGEKVNRVAAGFENAIHEHPDVVEVAVVGLPDPYRGQSAKAFVTLRAGAAPLTLEDLKVFLADRLGKHEMPAALEMRDSLPRSAVGKLLARVLLDEELAKSDAERAREESKEEKR